MQRSLTINIEINEVETESIRAASVQELNARLTAFFENYNITESLLQSKIKRRVLASYNRLLKESNLAALQRPPPEKKTPTAAPKPAPPEPRKPPAQPANPSLRPKSSLFDLGVKIGFGSSAFLKNHAFGAKRTDHQSKLLKLPTEKQNRADPPGAHPGREPVSQTTLNGFDASRRLAEEAGAGLSKTEFPVGQSKRGRDTDWLVAQFGTPKVPTEWKGAAGGEGPGAKSFAEESQWPLEKTNKKASVETSLDRQRTFFNQNGNGGHLEGFQDRQFMNRHSSIREPVKPFFGLEGGLSGGPVAQQTLSPQQVFSLLDGMKIGLISQKNMNISTLSVSYLKRLQPVIARIYSSDEATCFDFKDFEKMLAAMKIEL